MQCIVIYCSHTPLWPMLANIEMVYELCLHTPYWSMFSYIPTNILLSILLHCCTLVSKVMMSDFSIHNVELTAALRETCGRDLDLLPYTHQRMVEILETTARLRRAKNIDLRLQTVLEAAYFAVKPPGTQLFVLSPFLLDIQHTFSTHLLNTPCLYTLSTSS